MRPLSRRPQSPRAKFLALLLTGLLAWQPSTALDYPAMAETVAQRWGAAGTNRMKNWQGMLQEGLRPDSSELERLALVNTFVNKNIRFGTDLEVWEQEDYWATPLETVGRGSGDCEDFAITKYFSLLALGVPEPKLRFVYVRALQQQGQTLRVEPHMVLAYYKSPGAEPLVLDNLASIIATASQRSDLTPVFSFNQEGYFNGVLRTALKKGTRLSRWEDLLLRAANEGF
jgi:predicted transglutaminase-like cysteine proteinase